MDGRFRFPLLRRTDILILGALALASLTAVLFRGRVEGWPTLVLKNAGAAALYAGCLAVSGRLRRPGAAAAVRFGGAFILFAYINLAVADLQLVLYRRWLDDTVLNLESAVFGMQPLIWLQRFMSRPLTEWLMFAYVAYLPLYPIVGAAVYRKAGPAAAEEYIFALGCANVICDFGFILFPVAGPLYWISDRFTVPLAGGFWTRAADWLRHNGQFMGGSLPSLHCACATVMWLEAWRHHRRASWLIAPIVLSIYTATIYGRFHYVTDAVAGAAVAISVVALVGRGRRAHEIQESRDHQLKSDSPGRVL